MKRVLSSMMIGLVLLLCLLPMTALAVGDTPSDFTDIEKVYDFKTAETHSDVVQQMWNNRPTAIALKPASGWIRFAEKDLEDSFPIGGSTFIVEKGKETTYTINTTVNSKEYPENFISINGTLNLTYEPENNVNILVTNDAQLVEHFIYDFMGDTVGHELSDQRQGTSYSKWSRDAQAQKVYITLSIVGEKAAYATIKCEVVGVKTAKSSGGILAINTNASESGGETSVPVPAAIVVGVLGAAAAAAAAGAGAASGSGAAAASSGESGENSEDKNGSRYKMYIRKDFGDKIRYDQPALAIYARMAEVKADGTEIDRSDLTEQIEIFSDTGVMKVSGQTVSGNYLGALIEAESVKGATNPTEGVISFRFSGEGGSFQNNVTFKLVGDPYISFPERGDYLEMTVAMLFGDNAVYEVPFTLVDFTEKSITVKAQPQDGSPFTVELEALDDKNYIARIQNTSAKPDKVQAQSETFGINITAETESEYAKDAIRTTLYPEGLSVRVIKFDDDGYAQIAAYEDIDREEAGDVSPTRFLVELAVAGVDEHGKRKARLVDSGEYTPQFAALAGTEAKTEQLVKKFKYDIKDAGKGAYQFQPLQQIPELSNSYYVKLPISCDYAGEKYNLDLPARLIGERLGPISERSKERTLLLQRIRRYMPPEQWNDVLARIKPDLDTRSAEELRLMSKSIIMTAQYWLLDEAAEQIAWAEKLDWCIGKLEIIKWIGDQAFSFLANAFTGPVGDAILSPMKDMLAALIGEVSAQILLEEGFDYENLQLGNTAGAMLENLILSSIDVENHDLKQIAAVLAAFAVINVAKHYVLDLDKSGNRNFYNALIAGLGDLTANCMKMVGGKTFEKIMKSETMKKAMKTFVGRWIRQSLIQYLPDVEVYFSDSIVSVERFAIVKKYIEEICGWGTAELYAHREDIGTAVESKVVEIGNRLEASDYVISVTIWEDLLNPNQKLAIDIDLKKAKDGLFGFVFESIFAIFPFPSSKVEHPGDPVYTVS